MDLSEEAERWDLEPKPAGLWSDDGGHYDRHASRTAPYTFHKELKDSWLHFQISREDARLLERKNAKCKRGTVEGCEDLQKQRRAVEGEVQESAGARLLCILFWKRNLVLEFSHLGQN